MNWPAYSRQPASKANSSEQLIVRIPLLPITVARRCITGSKSTVRPPIHPTLGISSSLTIEAISNPFSTDWSYAIWIPASLKTMPRKRLKYCWAETQALPNMSRSKKKSPFISVVKSGSEKKDKITASRKFRHRNKMILDQTANEDQLLAQNAVSNTWYFNKDGKRRLAPDEDRKYLRK